MITSMVLYSLYKQYKKWRDGGTDANQEDGESLLDGEDGGGDGKSMSSLALLWANVNVLKNLKPIVMCTLYMFLGPGLILLNKYILKDVKFPYPMFLSGLGVAVSALVARVVVSLGFVQLHRKEAVEGSLWFRRVLPVGLAHAATLAFGNTVYLLLNVGFIQMLKSFTPVIILMTSMIARLENPNFPTIFATLLISIGTAATCSFTPEMSLIGLFVMFLAELAEAVRLLMTQFLLQNLSFGIIEGQYVLAPATAFWLFSASLVFEGNAMMQGRAIDIIKENPVAFLCASTMGLCINFLSYVVIQMTSSLTMKVLGSVRNIFTIVLGVMLWGDIISMQASVGYAITLSGFVAYNLAKSGSWERLQVPWCLQSRLPCCAALQVTLDGWDVNRAGRQSSSSLLPAGAGVGVGAGAGTGKNGDESGGSGAGIQMSSMEQAGAEREVRTSMSALSGSGSSSGSVGGVAAGNGSGAELVRPRKVSAASSSSNGGSSASVGGNGSPGGPVTSYATGRAHAPFAFGSGRERERERHQSMGGLGSDKDDELPNNAV
jgi:hypothetical protein